VDFLRNFRSKYNWKHFCENDLREIICYINWTFSDFNLEYITKEENNEPLTRVWQKWRFSAPQTHLWLIKHWFSASTFVVKIATFAKPETVTSKCKTTDNSTTNRQKQRTKMPTLRKIKRGVLPTHLPTQKHHI
jgi:hypothetical protein